MILINTVMILKNIDMIFIFPSHLLYFWNMETQKMELSPHVFLLSQPGESS